MEIYGVDYPNSLSHSKCRVDVLKHKATRGLVWAKVSHEEKTHLVPRSVYHLFSQNKLAKARKTRTSPSTLGLKKFGQGKL